MRVLLVFMSLVLASCQQGETHLESDFFVLEEQRQVERNIVGRWVSLDGKYELDFSNVGVNQNVLSTIKVVHNFDWNESLSINGLDTNSLIVDSSYECSMGVELVSGYDAGYLWFTLNSAIGGTHEDVCLEYDNTSGLNNINPLNAHSFYYNPELDRLQINFFDINHAGLYSEYENIYFNRI